MKGTDAIRCPVQSLSQVRRLGLVGRFQGRGTGRQAANLHPLDAPRIVTQGSIAFPAYVGHDLGHGLLGREIPAKDLP